MMSRVEKIIAQRVLGWGKRMAQTRPFLSVLGLGLLLPLCFAPFDVLPVFYLAYAGFFYVLCQHVGFGLRRLTLIGWTFGFGQLFIGLHWIGHAFLVEADKFGWVMPLGITALPAGLALFFALAVAVWAVASARAKILPQEAPLLSGLALALCLAGSEYLRGTILTGLPWNLPGMAWGGVSVLAQNA